MIQNNTMAVLGYGLLGYDVIGDTCTLPGTMVQSVHVAYDKWGLMPPYPLNCIQVKQPTISNVSRNNLEANRT